MCYNRSTYISKSDCSHIFSVLGYNKRTKKMEATELCTVTPLTDHPQEIIIHILEFVDYVTLYTSMIVTCKHIRFTLIEYAFMRSVLRGQFFVRDEAGGIIGALGAKCTLIMKHRACTILKNLLLKKDTAPYNVALTACTNVIAGKTMLYMEIGGKANKEKIRMLNCVSYKHYNLINNIGDIKWESLATWRMLIIECIEYLIKDIVGEQSYECTKDNKAAVAMIRIDEYIFLKAIRRCLSDLGQWTDLLEKKTCDFITHRDLVREKFQLKYLKRGRSAALRSDTRDIDGTSKRKKI